LPLLNPSSSPHDERIHRWYLKPFGPHHNHVREGDREHRAVAEDLLLDRPAELNAPCPVGRPHRLAHETIDVSAEVPTDGEYGST